MNENKKLSALITDLEDVVSQIDKDDIDIEDAFDLYKKGMDLAKACDDKLKVVEESVLQVTGDKDNLIEVDIVEKEAQEDFSQEKLEEVAETTEISEIADAVDQSENNNEKEVDSVESKSSDNPVLQGLFE